MSGPRSPRVSLASQINTGEILPVFEDVLSGKIEPDELPNDPRVQAAINSKSGNQIRYLGGDNNKNYVIKNSDDTSSVVLQLSTCRAENLQAVNALNKPDYLAKCFRISQVVPDTKASAQAGENVSDEERLPRVARVVELCDSNIDKKTRGMQPQDRVMLAARMAGQCSATLEHLSKNGVLWTDFKPGNVLLDRDGNIKIPDTKALIRVDDVAKKHNKAEFEDVTKPLCSRAFIDADHAGIPYADRQKVIESEYNYQLGVLLHYVATGELKQNNTNSSNLHNSNKKDMIIDYDKFPEVYSTPAGIELRNYAEHFVMRRV